MASLQAYAADLMLRLLVKRKLKGNTDLAAARRILSSGRFNKPKTVRFEQDSIGGIAGEWVTSGQPEGGILLYLHGGGYFACSPSTHRPITSGFAERGWRVFVPDYRLAPEYPFPAAIEDAVAAWDGLVALGHSPGAMAVAGDSAGGGLTLALLLSLRDRGSALPGCGCLFSPWTDLAGTGASIVKNAKRDAMFWQEGLAHAASVYLAGAAATTALASPVYADLRGLPPLLIHAGEREILLDDSLRLADRARAAGVSVELQTWPVVAHVWQLLSFVPEAGQSLDLAASFIHRHRQAA